LPTVREQNDDNHFSLLLLPTLGDIAIVSPPDLLRRRGCETGAVPSQRVMIQPNTTQERAKHAVTATAIVIVVALHPLSTLAQRAKDVKGATPLVAIQNEAPARLIVDPQSPNGSPWVAYSFSTGRKTCALYRYSAKPLWMCRRALAMPEFTIISQSVKTSGSLLGRKADQYLDLNDRDPRRRTVNKLAKRPRWS
jgi:hypothetical protein